MNGILRNMLQRLGYRTGQAYDGVEALDLIAAEMPDLVITDINMPRLNGFELTERIKTELSEQYVPVIILTGTEERKDRIHGLEIGADEFLFKPFDPVELRVRVGSLLKLKRFTDDLESAEHILFTLALTVAAKDAYTRGHCQRIADNARVVGELIGLDEQQLQTLWRGAFLHDIGKLAIPDRILLKADALDEQEFHLMMEHTVKGEEICRPLRTLEPALPIIRSHHERVDGNGYPDNLSGEDIPLGARIVAAVDLFDALITDRPYRSRLPLPRAVDMLREAAHNGHIDPAIGEILVRAISESKLADRVVQPDDGSPAVGGGACQDPRSAGHGGGGAGQVPPRPANGTLGEITVGAVRIQRGL